MTERLKAIDEKTSLPLKVIVPLLGMVASATWLLSAQVSAVKGDVQKVSEKLDGVWTVGNMQLWAERVKASNPQLNVPSVAEVWRDEHVRSKGAPAAAVAGYVRQ